MADQLLKVRENVQTLNEMKKVSIEFKNDRDSKYNMRTAKYELEKKGHKVEISGNMLTVTAKRGSDIGREARDVRNFYTGVKRIKALESVEVELDEFVRNAPKGMTTYKVSDNKLQGNMDAKDAKDLEKKMKAKGFNMKKATIYYHKGTSSSRYYIMRNGKPVSEENLDEGRMKELAMKIAQVYSNMKKDKNMRSFADKFRKDVAKSLDIRKSLEKVLPDYVAGKDITNIMSKHVPGHKEENKVEEKLDKDDEEEVKDVIKGLKKAVKTHDGQVKDLEKAVNEWFKSKNIDVKVRELEESTQVYVPLGRRIPNEIREELITTQYGKMPEDVKNVKDINYGNFMENSITMNNDFWTKVLHGTKGE